MNWRLPFTQLLDLVYPRICACGLQVCTAPRTYVCETCLQHFWSTDFEHHLVTNSLYQRLPPDLPLTGTFAGWFFQKDTLMQTHLHTIKYRRGARAAYQLGLRCGQRLQGKVPAHYVVVPVPLHVRKERKRGYNQAAWAARGLAEGAGLPYIPALARRRVHNPSQTRLKRAERLANVEGIFTVKGPPPPAILLVDDVITTGATIAELARTFVAAGTAELIIASLVLADD
ncbi:MAG: ComF family protein [Bacteroidetes bacterium]|nr:ComF family protein [Bacteroidota bacterium]